MRIIVIEDEEYVCKCVSELIEEMSSSYHVIVRTTNSLNGWNLIEKLVPDVVVTDIKMSGLSGLDLIKMAREKRLPTKFIIISAYSDFEYAREAIKYKVNAYIVKPITYEEVKEALQSISCESENLASEEEMPQMLAVRHPSIQKAIKYIEQHYSEPITQASIVEKLHLSTQYFSQLFHKETGIKFSRYLMNHRVKVAKTLLALPNARISDVAKEVGYEDEKYFHKVFKHITGVSPREYMQKFS